MEENGSGEATLMAALTAVEATGRLAVHVWAALEQGNPAEAMRLLGAMSGMTSAALVRADLDGETAALVRAGARDLVNPVIGWPSAALSSAEQVALHA